MTTDPAALTDEERDLPGVITGDGFRATRLGDDGEPLTDEQAAMIDAQREDLRARMRAATTGATPDPEQFMRDAHSAVTARLEELRATRNRYNDLIREAVAEEKLLRQAVGVFDRARS